MTVACRSANDNVRIRVGRNKLLILFVFTNTGWFMGKLTTHVLDTAAGRPGAGIGVKLFAMENGRHLVASAITNEDGRTDEPMLAGDTFRGGTYELQFSVGPYFRERESDLGDPAFLDDVVIRVTLSADEHYHVPLLVSPWSYSTYRGS